MPKIDEVRGKLLESRPESRIFAGFPYNLYEILAPGLSAEELRSAKQLVKAISRSASLGQILSSIGVKDRAIADQFRNAVIGFVDANSLLNSLPSAKQEEILKMALLPIVENLGIGHKQAFVNYIFDYGVGYGDLSPLMSDPQLEEIMVNGFDRNIFVFHKKFGNCKTNIFVDEKSGVLELIKRISSAVNKQFSDLHPLLDARLPDGSRANATFNYVSPFGHTLTIRKFSSIPLSIVDLIAGGMVDSGLAAFLWVMVQGLGAHPMNLIITGGTGSGKTTLMNVLASFIPFEERIVSMEDTIELDLGVRENWIQMESKPKIKDVHAVSMDDLLKNTLRMRPDRIIVGEVRGEEAGTLFVAMDTGHRGILGTLHSNSAREMMIRLKNAPMNVPEQMLPLLDLVIVLERHYTQGQGIVRSVKQVAEIGRMDETVLLSNIYEVDEKAGQTVKTRVPSSLVEKLAASAGITKNELSRELRIRQGILEFMIAEGIRERSDVESLIQHYYFDPEPILKRVTERLGRK